MNLLLTLLALGLGDPDPSAELPLTLSAVEPASPLTLSAAEPAAPGDDASKGIWVGPRLGYIEAKDADNGTWLVGAQVRWHILSFLAVEGSIDFHRDEYDSGDIKVWTVPVMVTGIVYLPVDWKLQPYGLAGIGWYYTRTEFSGANNNKDESTGEFGFHVGFGGELTLSPGLTIDADFRYLFVSEPPHVGDANFDSWEITIGLNFKLGK